jgi:RNA recognition motif-containing protein
MNIYVSNLNFRTMTDSLQELFERYGEVSSAHIVTERETGRSRGFGFVEMPSDDQARQAIEALNDTEFEGKKITVNEARPKTERGDRGGYNRGGGGGFNRGGGYDRGGNGGGYGRNRY